jgi:hypothetical protein
MNDIQNMRDKFVSSIECKGLTHQLSVLEEKILPTLILNEAQQTLFRRTPSVLKFRSCGCPCQLDTSFIPRDDPFL